ncbi:MAG: PilX N-terminal domain-containing pilus assembly protein, partial [Candidatus Zixiibacteriota bacterium]
MFKIFQNQKGTALLIALMMMLMLSLISIASVMTSVTDMDISQNAKQGTRAFYLAEAGIERSIAQLSDSISWRDGYTNEPLDGGTYNVLIQDSSSVPSLGQNLLITSTGDIYGARSTVEVTLAPNFKRRFTYGLFAEDDLTIRNEVLVDSYDSDSGSYASQ